MTDILPTILMAVLCAMVGGAICFHIGYATRNPKRKGEHSSGYALYVLLYGKRYNIYRWDDVQCIHLDSKEETLFIRLHSGEELHTTEWCSYGITSICDVIKELNEELDKY